MSKRIYFNAWNLQGMTYPAYAMSNGYSRSESVAKSIARVNGLTVITVKNQGAGVTHGTVDSLHYSATLGHRCPDGGYTPVRDVWFAIRHSR